MQPINPSISARKVLLHALPPNLTREEFLAQLPSPWLLQPSHRTIVVKDDVNKSKKCKLLLYVRGEISKQRNLIDFSRAYVLLETAVAVKKFCEELHGVTFITTNKGAGGGGDEGMSEKLKSTNAVVELAPVSRLPSKPAPDRVRRDNKRRGRNRRDRNRDVPPPKEVPLENNPFFLQFLKEEKEATSSSTSSKGGKVVAGAARGAKSTGAKGSGERGGGGWGKRSPSDVRSPSLKLKAGVRSGGGSGSGSGNGNGNGNGGGSGVNPTAPDAPPVSHLVQQIVAAREREDRVRRQQRQERARRNKVSVSGLKKRSGGEGDRVGEEHVGGEGR